MSHRSLVIACIVVFSCALVSHAQVTTGTISGTVADSTGAVLPGASVLIQNEDTGITRTVTADASGRYLAPQLSLGNYHVTGSAQGFQSEVRSGISLTVGREAVVDLKLSVGTVTQSVEVTGEAPLVETTEATVSYLINARTVEDLPLNGRDLSQLILLNPGVSQAVNGVGGSAYAGWGRKISISGSRAEDNAYLLDGSYVNDMNHHIATGPDGSLLGVETVREFQVLTNSFGAQYGRTLGGVFNAVSKSGTNELHGDVYEYLRNSDLDARDFFARQNAPAPTPVNPFRRNQFGGTVGGPIKKDRIFYFLAYEGMRSRYSQTVVSVVPDVGARSGNLGTAGTVQVSSVVQPFLALFPIPNGIDFGDGTAQYIFPSPQPTDDDFGMARIDYQISSSDSMFGRFAASKSTQTVVVSYPGYLQLPSMATDLLTLGETHIFSPALLLTAHLSFNRVVPADGEAHPQVSSALEGVPGQGAPNIAPGSGITGLSQYGTPNDFFITNRLSPQGDMNWTLGGHSLQFGAMLEHMQYNQNFPNRPNGGWTWGSLSAFLQDQTALSFRGTPPGFGFFSATAGQWLFASYFQDDWKITPRLTLNLGLRWEPYGVPTLSIPWSNLRNLSDPNVTRGDPLWINHSFRDDFEPRFGFAWSPFASGKTAVRGGFGITDMPNDASVWRNEISRNAAYAPDLNFPDTGKFPSALAEIAAFQASQQITLGYATDYSHFKTPYVMQFNVNLQQQLGQSNMLSVGYTGSRGRDLTTNSDIDQPNAIYDGVSLAYPVGATRINPIYAPGSFQYISAQGSLWYNALNLLYQHRFAHGFQGQASYTFSKDVNQADSSQSAEYSGSGSGTLPYAHDLKADQGLSGFNVAQVFSLSYEYDVPSWHGGKGVVGQILSGWQTTGLLSLQSGQPFTVSSSEPAALSSIDSQCCRPNLAVPHESQIVSGTTAGCGSVPAGHSLGGPDLYFDPCAFTFPGPRELGNTVRNFLIGPGVAKLDPGLMKETALRERLKLQFRAEFFNLFNRPNFAKPASAIFTSSGALVGSAGKILATIPSAPARQIQFSLKLVF